MPIDFTRLRSNDNRLPSHPRHIFALLSGRESGFGYLRDVQGQVLDAWYERRAERDITIKMNTGTGKTAVGLLALLSSINDGCGPALYVTPDKFLTEQAGDHAERLGIKWTDDPDSPAYLASDSIGIINIKKLVNGRSIFGGPQGRRDEPIPIKSLVIDDAHACVKAIEEQTTMCIPRSHTAYNEMFELFQEDLRQYSPANYSDIEDPRSWTVMRVPIWNWAKRNLEVIEILKKYQEDDLFLFNWPFVRGILASCQATFSSKSFEIRPLCPPTNNIISLDEAQRRLYLTATLADDSILITHFGVSEASAQNPISPSSAADIGDRLILSPLALNPLANEASIRQVVSSLADDHNVVVLVPSYRHAAMWDEYTERIVGADDIAQVVELLKDGHVGLVVFVNKYDGIDLPGDACRILVIDGIPEAITNSDRREAEILGGSDFLAQHKLQIIEQGMGRGVRSTEDYCVVLLMGTSLSKVLARPEMRERLSPATRTQLELSMAIAEQIGSNNLDDMLGVIELCLNRDIRWLKCSRQSLAGVTYATGSIELYSFHFRRAFEASVIEQFGKACAAMQDAQNATNDNKLVGWLLEQLATYKQQIDPVQAQHILTSAIGRNPRVMRPASGVTYRRASTGTDQAKAAYTAIANQFKDQTELILGFRELADRLSFNNNASDFESAMEELGNVLGFNSQRPEQEFGKGPDVLWSVGNSKYLIIECKNEAKAEVWKRDAAQLAHSMSWFLGKYDQTDTGIPILVHHNGYHAQEAIPPPHARVLDKVRLQKLCESLKQFARALSNRSPYDRTDVLEVLQHQGLMAGDFIDRYTVFPPNRTR